MTTLTKPNPAAPVFPAYVTMGDDYADLVCSIDGVVTVLVNARVVWYKKNGTITVRHEAGSTNVDSVLASVDDWEEVHPIRIQGNNKVANTLREARDIQWKSLHPRY